MGEHVAHEVPLDELPEDQFFAAPVAPLAVPTPLQTPSVAGPHAHSMPSVLSAPVAPDSHHARLWDSDPRSTGFHILGSPELEAADTAAEVFQPAETADALGEAMERDATPDVSYLSEIHHDSEDEHEDDNDEGGPGHVDVLSCSGWWSDGCGEGSRERVRRKGIET